MLKRRGAVVRLNDDLYRRFAMRCAYEGMTLHYSSSY
jgi:hypothetical protein